MIENALTYYSQEYLNSVEEKKKKSVMANKEVRIAIKKGIIKKPLCCERCNEKKDVSAHHNNYDYPLEIIWLCNKCHKLMHVFINQLPAKHSFIQERSLFNRTIEKK